ncbi:MAG TPA: hypothetical protein PKX74_06345 [Leptospiraceae bacterium]|nr:hypothetical protein [Leptospiraceae bacterium]
MLRSVIVLVAFCAATGTLLAGNGTLLFNQAYKLEETDPSGAVEIYHSAIQAGLTTELHRAARWRLFFIFKDQENFPEALRESEYLPASARTQLVEYIRERYSPSKTAFESYLSGIRLIISSDSEKRNQGAVQLEKIYSTSDRLFQKRILLDMSEHGSAERALNLIRSSGKDTASVLRECDLLIYLGRLYEAEQSISKLLANQKDDFSTEEKMRLVYLLGRARRDSGPDVEMFRISEKYATGEEKMRMRALAAYALLRHDYPVQARALMKDNSSSDPDVQLLDLVLRAEIDRDPQALRTLQGKKESLKSTVRKKKDAYLAQRALRLIAGVEH